MSRSEKTMKEIMLLIMIGMLGLVSAISISPDRLDLNLSVGESYTNQFEIHSEMESNVSIVSINKNCLIIEENFSVDNGINYKNLTIYIPFDASPMEQDCEFEVSFIDILSSTYVERSSGGGHSHKVITPPKNLENQTSMTNQTSVVLTNETINVVNETIDLDDGLIDYENVDGIDKTTQRESFVNKIGNFFESIWNWIKELFR